MTSFVDAAEWVLHLKMPGANTITDVNVSHIAAITEQNAKEYGQMVLDAEKDHGYLEQYKYLQTATETGAMIIFLDCTTQLEAVQSFLYLSCGIAALVFGVVFLLVVFFSRRAIAPIASNMEKQRQFITDAGHELKTPLAIIAANTDVLALYSGENEWTESIRISGWKWESWADDHSKTMSGS